MNIVDNLFRFWEDTGFHNATWENMVMILIGLVLIFLAIRFSYKPLLLIPMGMGVILGNIPFFHDAPYQLGIYEEGSVLHYLFFGVLKGIYPALIFLGLGAMTDLSSLISNPKLMLLGAAARSGSLPRSWVPLCLGFQHRNQLPSPLSGVPTEIPPFS